MEVWDRIPERKEFVRPGGKSGLLRIGVSGPGVEEMFKVLHVFWNNYRVLPIRGCCLHVSGI